MVRAVSCHHFVSQDVFLSENEPVAFCGAQNKLLVATVQQAVNVHDLENRGNVLHSFSTIDVVKQILYCESGNYVATLETKASWQQTQVSYVRIYFRWWVSIEGQPLKVRVAGCQPAPSRTFEMVELPLEGALCIACCSRTSAIGIGLGSTVSVYCYVTKVCSTSKQAYNDFEHFADIAVPIVVRTLSMCENYFACMSDQSVHFFKVACDAVAPAEDVPEPVPIPDSTDSDLLDENFIEWRFESCTYSHSVDKAWDDHLKSKLHPSSFPINVHFHIIDKANETFSSSEACEFHGPLLTVRGCSVDVRLDPKTFEMFPTVTSAMQAVTLLFRHFTAQGEDSKLSALQLVPFFRSEKSQENTVDPLNAAASKLESCSSSLPWPNVLSSSSSTLRGMGCFFSTPKEGFLYDLTHRTQLVTTYVYTSAMKGATLNASLLHALTETGLETYTVHLARSVLSQLEKVEDVKNTVPNFEDPVCLLGLRPFLGVDHLVRSDNHLILVSSVEDSVSNTEPDGKNRSTLYSLKEPEPVQVFSDLVEMADSQQSSSAATYFCLLSEAHMILRTQVSFGESSKEMASLYRKSCLMLADYCLCYDPLQIVKAVPFYHLSLLTAENVVKRILDLRHQLKLPDAYRALVLYLQSILFDENSCQPLSLPQGTADAILSAYSEESPENLWKVVLCSNFEGYKLDKAIMILKRRLTSKRQPLKPSLNAADTAALAYLLLQKSSSDAAQTMMKSIDKADLVALMTSIESKIWKGMTLQNFGKFLMQSRPDAFNELLVSYVEAKKFQISDVLQILQAEFPNNELHCVPILTEFLEAILSKEKNRPIKVDPSVQNLLVKIYLKRLLSQRETVTSSSVIYSNSMLSLSTFFSSRPLWLNEMPPFNGKGISKLCLRSSGNENETSNPSLCCCWNCNEELLRLQSLLSYLGPSEDTKGLVLDFLCSAREQNPNWLSIQVMCSNEAQAVRLLLGRTPKALLPYATETFKDCHEKWSKLFTTLFEHITNIPEDHPHIDIYTHSFNATLAHLAEILTPEEFLPLIPRGENPTFLPHVQRCVERHQADQLKIKIVALGQEIKSMLLSSSQ